METMFVRLKPYDPRRGHVLRRYTYRGIKFHEDRGWFRVPKDVADYLRAVRQVPGDEHSPLAFDCIADLDERPRNVIVCNACLMACCWRGKFMCDESMEAGLTTRTPAELRELGREHPDYYAKDDNYPDAERPGPQ